MTRKLARILLIFALLALLALACVDTGGGNGYDATATYGAQQYHVQETAQAEVQP